ncbi:MAG: ATP-binding protein [Spirochaetales bacterium]|jgi:predicted AAA+ superfamily ATPase|nr:ATP-binding protein [Spirochaetales bacterium]
MDTFIPRHYDVLHSFMMPKRVTVIYGPRRVGKTTLVSKYLETLGKDARVLRASGDNLSDRSLLSSQEAKLLLEWASGYDTVFIDEAQRIPDIGWGLKILIDARPELSLIVTGSFSFDLAHKLGEPLTLYPLAVGELLKTMNAFELRQNLEDFLVFGMYPEVRTAASAGQKQIILNELTESYLLKDILELERIKKPKMLVNLLTLIALQVGSEVSLNELSGKLGVDMKTVERYLDLLEKCFVLYNLRGFSRNLRSEVTKKSKYYFYDTGVRNAVIRNYNPLALRNDAGALWENFMILERLKARSYGAVYARDYFWRTWEKQEIDLLEEREGCLYAFEFKWSPKKKAKIPSAFSAAYPDSIFQVISPENFLQYLGCDA